MQVSDHLSQHDAIDDLPLLTESATVTDVTVLDRSRNDEVLAALRTTLDAHGGEAWERDRPDADDDCAEWIRDRLDPVDHLDGGAPLNEYLSDDTDADRLTALQERFLQPYPSLLSVTVETDEPVEFVAGQYLSLRYEDTARVYSIASSPTRDDIEFCIGRVPGGELTTEIAVDLEAGDEVTLRGPYGDLVLDEPSPRDLVFMATGTGVAPLKSMIEYAFEAGFDGYDGETRDVWLFLGDAWVDSLPYHDTFASLAESRANFHYVPTASRESYLTDWDGETAYVQYALVKYLDGDALDGGTLPEAFERHMGEPARCDVDARLDPSHMEVYACGLNAMVHGLVDAVDRLGVPPEQTQFEGFG